MNFLSSEIVLMYELFFFPAIEILISYSFNKTYNSTFANIIKEVVRLYLGAGFVHCFKPYTIRQARFLVCVFFWCQCVVLIFFLIIFFYYSIFVRNHLNNECLPLSTNKIYGPSVQRSLRILFANKH